VEPDLDTQLAQATLNLLRHVAMSAPLPVIQSLKDQLEARYQNVIEPIHPGVEFLIQATLDGDFETVLPMVSGLIQVGAAPPTVQALEQSLGTVPPPLPRTPEAPRGSSPALFRGAGKAYRNFFQPNQ